MGKRSAPLCALFLFPTNHSEFPHRDVAELGAPPHPAGPCSVLCCLGPSGAVPGGVGGGGQVAGGARSALQGKE